MASPSPSSTLSNRQPPLAASAAGVAARASPGLRNPDGIRSSSAGTGSANRHSMPASTSAGRRPSNAAAMGLGAGYPGLHELVEERLFPFMQQVVGFLGIGFPDQNNCGQLDGQGNPAVASDPSKVAGGAATASAGGSTSPCPNDVGGSDGALASSTGAENGGSSFDDQQATCSYYDDIPSQASGEIGVQVQYICTGHTFGFKTLSIRTCKESTTAGNSNEEKLGRIQFSLNYNSKDMVLTLKVMRAAELAAKDFSGTSDPYVKILLLPDKKSKLQTNVKRKNLNPRWNETFAFEGFPYSKLISRTLYLQVFDYDRFSRDDPIGEVCLPLSEVDLSKTQTMWKTLQPCKGHTGKLGELLVSLNYQPSVSVISIGIIKARNLKAKDINGLSDPYVKIWLTHEGKKVEKKKTPVKEKTLNPIFEETIMFTVPYEKIRQTSLIVSVMDYDRVGRNEPIGQLVLGSKSGPMEVKHWNEMFAKTKTDVVKWHILKDLS